MKDDGEERADPILHRSLIGRILYLNASRLEIMFDVNLLFRYMKSSNTKHFGAVKRVLRCNRGGIDYGIRYRSVENGDLLGYSDS